MDESQNGLFKKTKHAKFSVRVRQIFHTYVYVSGGTCSFFGKFGVHCFLEVNVLRFALLPNYRRILPETYGFLMISKAIEVD